MFQRLTAAAICAAICVLPLCGPAVLQAQGVLLEVNAKVALPRVDRHLIMPRPRPLPTPRPSPQSYKIKELTVNATLADQIAKVQVTQSFVNTGSRQMEVTFVYPLPYDGAVDQLTFMVDGKEYEAKLLSAKEARSIYEGYIRRNQDPALMEWMGRGMFKTSVFPVPPGAERKVTLKFTQVLKKSGGLTEFMFPLSTAKYSDKPVETVSVNLNIQSQTPLKNVYSPTHSVDIKRPTGIQAVCRYEAKNEIPSSDFRLMFDVGSGPVGASVLSYRPNTNEDGYFLMLVTPEVKEAGQKQPRKTVVFVVDRSGSMSGKKIDQAKNALKFVLNNLNQGDLFNVVAYDSTVESFKPELQKYNDETRKAALGFVEGIYAGGSTNIDGALKTAMSHLKDDSQPSYIVFLTDGMPTAGETKETQIVVNAADRNKVRARVFSMGVGYDVNSRLLDKLARKCFGQSEYVRPNEDIEDHVSRLYKRIGAPALSQVDIAYSMEGFGGENGSPVSRVYPRDAYDIFAGDQLVLVGRYKKPGAAKVQITGRIGEQKKSFDFPAQLTGQSGDETYGFVEKLWAVRRVGEIIDDIDLNGKNQELVDELVALSTRHGILTPYTSFLADDQPNGAPVPLAAASRDKANLALDSLQESAGKAGVAQRAAKGKFQQAARAGLAGAATFRDKQDREVTVNTVQNVGAKTFYLRGDRWVDSALQPAQQKKVQRVARYSKDYFDLVQRHGRDAAQYLAIQGKVTVVLDGQAYEF